MPRTNTQYPIRIYNLEETIRTFKRNSSLLQDPTPNTHANPVTNRISWTRMIESKSTMSNLLTNSMPFYTQTLNRNHTEGPERGKNHPIHTIPHDITTESNPPTNHTILTSPIPNTHQYHDLRDLRSISFQYKRPIPIPIPDRIRDPTQPPQHECLPSITNSRILQDSIPIPQRSNIRYSNPRYRRFSLSSSLHGSLWILFTSLGGKGVLRCLPLRLFFLSLRTFLKICWRTLGL